LEALRKVCDFIRQAVALRNGQRSGTKVGAENVVLSDSLRKSGEHTPSSKGGVFAARFEKSIVCAYSDYQRGEGLCGTCETSSRIPVVKVIRRHPSLDTEVVIGCKVCSHCGSKRLSRRNPSRVGDRPEVSTRQGRREALAADYVIQRYRCRSCGALFTSGREPSMQSAGYLRSQSDVLCVTTTYLQTIFAPSGTLVSTTYSR